MDHDDLLRIGLFSQLSFLSVRMLRHYQERGILVPAVVDEVSGYRFYRAEQLVEARLVGRLRDAGFPIGEIARVLAVRGDPSSVSVLVERQRARLAAERAEVAARLSALDHLSVKETTMSFPVDQVQLTTLPAMTVLALRRTLAQYADEGELWTEMMPLVVSSGAVTLPDPVVGSVFHDEQYRTADVDVEIFLQVAGPVDAAAPLTCREVPEQQVVQARLLGSYDGMPAVTAAIGAYIAQHRLRTGPMFDIYRVGPAHNPDPSAWVTDVCFPVLPA